jgi:hypothetical protein
MLYLFVLNYYILHASLFTKDRRSIETFSLPRQLAVFCLVLALYKDQKMYPVRIDWVCPPECLIFKVSKMILIKYRTDPLYKKLANFIHYAIA